MADTFEWFAQIRRWHSYRCTLVTNFVTKAAFHLRTAEDGRDEYTMVELFLPRSKNIYAGHRTAGRCTPSPVEDLSRFPKPDDVDPLDWPPPDAVRTWLYGQCSIVPRTSSTDFLPTPPTALPPGGAVPAAITQGGWVVGPNGRVP